MNAPMTPTMMFMMQPWRWFRPVIMLAIQPASAPKTIQEMHPSPELITPTLYPSL